MSMLVCGSKLQQQVKILSEFHKIFLRPNLKHNFYQKALKVIQHWKSCIDSIVRALTGSVDGYKKHEPT